MKHFLKIFALIAVVLTTTAVDCDMHDYDRDLFTLQNNSNKVIAWYIPTYGEYLDNTLPEEMPYTLAYESNYIKPGRSYCFQGYYDISYEYMPEDVVKLYIFEVETLARYTWEQIREDGLYAYCYNLTVEGLKESDKTICYPEE